MTQNPFAQYSVDEPLIMEELELLEFLRTSEDGEEHLNRLDETGVRIIESGDGLCVVLSNEESDALEQLLNKFLNPLSVNLYNQGHRGVALGCSALAFRIASRSLNSAQRAMLTSRYNLAFCLSSLGREPEALPMYEHTLADQERFLGVDHRDTLSSRDKLANCLKSLGYLSEALPVYQRILSDRERIMGADHRHTLSSCNKLAICLEALGRSPVALPLHKRALIGRERILGVDHPSTLASRNSLAVCLESVGRASEALALHKRNQTYLERAKGVDHPDTLTCRANMAGCLETLGRVSEALLLYESTLADEERILGADHKATMSSRNNLAGCLESLGRASEALPLYQRTLKDRERILDKDDPARLTSRSNLAVCLESLGRVSEALSIHESTLADRERILGDDHPATLGSRHNLAVCLNSLGRASEALPLQKRTLAEMERILGTDHPDTLASRSSLAVCLKSLERESEALPLLECTLADRERVQGLKHPETLMCRDNLANCLIALGRASEALPLYERNLADWDQELGSDHPKTLTSRSKIARCLIFLGRAQEALPLCKRTLADRTRKLGITHPDTQESRDGLAVCLACLDRLPELQPLYRRTITELERTQGPSHPDTLKSRYTLAVYLRSVGRSQEALPLFESVLADQERVLGVDPLDTLQTRAKLAACLVFLKRAPEGLLLLESVVADRERIQGTTHPDTMMSCHNLAVCLQSVGRKQEALALLERTLTDQENVLGGDHLDTLRSRDAIVICLESLGRVSEALPLCERNLIDRERVQFSGHRDTLETRDRLASILETLEKPDNALKQWRTQVVDLRSRPEFDDVWWHLFSKCSLKLGKYALESRFGEWVPSFDDLAQSMLDVVDLLAPEKLDAARKYTSVFFWVYLNLCITKERHDLIPKVLSSRQGRKLAALLLEELDAAAASLPPDSPKARFQKLRVELRQLALGLQVIPGGKSGSEGDGQRFIDSDTAIPRQREQMAQYKAKLEDYRVLKAELQSTDLDFAVSAAALNPELSELQNRLSEGEGLVLLFEYDTLEQLSRMALLIAHNSSVLVPLQDMGIQQGADLTGLWRGQLHTRAGMRRTGQRDVTAETSALDIQYNLGNDLAAAMRGALWHPLESHLKDLNHLHVVTHGSWHMLPVELGAPDGLSLSLYPGFIYYHRLRHQSIEPVDLSPDPSVGMGQAVQAADEDPSLETIPFVSVEAALVESLWPGPVYKDPDLHLEQPEYGVIQLAAHGEVDEADPVHANVVLGDRLLDFHAILNAGQHPPVVVLSACTVGRTTEDPDGEPLGLVGAFLFKGTRYVIASLQPVPDFYMPLLMALFYQAWNITGSPVTALAEAKRRFSSGDWYSETEALLRTHYRPVIEQALATASQQPSEPNWEDPVLQLTHAWPFPRSYRELHPDDDQHRLAELCESIASSEGRGVISVQILDTMVEERDRLPPVVIDTLCTWVRGFGVCSG